MDPRIATIERPRTRGSTQLATQKLPGADLTREEMRTYTGKVTPGARSTEKQMLAISTREVGLGTVLDVDNAAFERRSRDPTRATQDEDTASGHSTASDGSMRTNSEDEELGSRCAAALGADKSVPKQKQTSGRAHSPTYHAKEKRKKSDHQTTTMMASLSIHSPPRPRPGENMRSDSPAVRRGQGRQRAPVMELLSEESVEGETEADESDANSLGSQRSSDWTQFSTGKPTGKRGGHTTHGPSPLTSAGRSGGSDAPTGGARRKTSSTLYRELAEKTVRDRLSSIEAAEQESLSNASTPRKVRERDGETEQADSEEQDGFFEGMGINPALPPQITNLFNSRNRRTGMDALGWSATKGYITVPGRTNLRFSRPPYKRKEYGVKDIEQVLPGEPGHHDWTRYPPPDQEGNSTEEDENNNSTLLSDRSSEHSVATEQATALLSEEEVRRLRRKRELATQFFAEQSQLNAAFQREHQTQRLMARTPTRKRMPREDEYFTDSFVEYVRNREITPQVEEKTRRLTESLYGPGPPVRWRVGSSGSGSSSEPESNLTAGRGRTKTRGTISTASRKTARGIASFE